jgi:hypothetical protein
MKTSDISFLLAIGVGADVAHANCGPLLDALEKADQQPRFAMYDIASRDQPLTGRPLAVRIGKVIYDASGGDLQRRDAATNPVVAKVREAAKTGSARCEPGGSDTYRGTAANKIRFHNPLLPKRYNLNPMTIWIAKGSGLPLFHELNDTPGGYAWVYGDAVKEPPVKK